MNNHAWLIQMKKKLFHILKRNKIVSPAFELNSPYIMKNMILNHALIPHVRHIIPSYHVIHNIHIRTWCLLELRDDDAMSSTPLGYLIFYLTLSLRWWNEYMILRFVLCQLGWNLNPIFIGEVKVWINS